MQDFQEEICRKLKQQTIRTIPWEQDLWFFACPVHTNLLSHNNCLLCKSAQLFLRDMIKPDKTDCSQICDWSLCRSTHTNHRITLWLTLLDDHPYDVSAAMFELQCTQRHMQFVSMHTCSTFPFQECAVVYDLVLPSQISFTSQVYNFLFWTGTWIWALLVLLLPSRKKTCPCQESHWVLLQHWYTMCCWKTA